MFKRILNQIIFIFLCAFIAISAQANTHAIHFSEINMLEFVKFVSKIAEVNFIYNERDLNFSVSMISGKPLEPKEVLHMLLTSLQQNGFHVRDQRSCLLIEKMSERAKASFEEQYEHEDHRKESTRILPVEEYDFHIYKLQYHQGEEIEKAIKQIANDLKGRPNTSIGLLDAISTMQYVPNTNSLLYSGSPLAIEKLTTLIKRLDIARKQVFIEVLVIETDVKNGLEFGLEWAAGGKYLDKFGFATGNFAPSTQGSSFAKEFQDVSASSPPTGQNQFPLGKGFDLGIIGDIIMHKGRSFITLGSLVSALQADGDSTIVLNQKIITQDNQNASIFVGDNIPFTGSVVQTIGSSQQTTSNLEYKDVGVSLNIKPLLGEDEMITLELSEEISQATNSIVNNNSSVNGIQTTKTNMLTKVHVPDRRFLILSGMIRNTKTNKKTGIPCLGGLPMIGAAFSKSQKDEEKRNVIIFVRPQIIHTEQEYELVTSRQQKQFKKESGDPTFFQEGLDSVSPSEEELLLKKGLEYLNEHSTH